MVSGGWLLKLSDFDMEALYHQTNGLLSQTQGYYVRLEQGGAGDDLERLEVEVLHISKMIIPDLWRNLPLIANFPGEGKTWDTLGQ